MKKVSGRWAGAATVVAGLVLGGCASLPGAKAPAGELGLDVWRDRGEPAYVSGDPLRVSVRPHQDAQVAVLQVGSAGETRVLFPNGHRGDARVKAQETLQLPWDGAPFALRVGNEGRVLLRVLATTAVAPIIDSQDLWPSADGFSVLRHDADEARRRVEAAAQSEPNRSWAVRDEWLEVRAPKAESAPPVSPSLPQPQPVPPSQPQPAPPTAVATPVPPSVPTSGLIVRMERSEYRIRETASVNLLSDRDCALQLYAIDARNQARQLYPNTHVSRVDLRAGQWLRLPRPADGQVLRVGEPEGMTTLVALCGPAGESLRQAEARVAALRRQPEATRGVFPVLASEPAVTAGASEAGMLRATTQFRVLR